MSAIGTKRTYRVALQMSAFGGKADILDRHAAIDSYENVSFTDMKSK